MNFRTRLILLFLLIGIIPITLLGYLHFHYANKILKQQAVNQLISLREDRKAQLQSFFKHLRLDMKMLSDHRLLKDILSDYIAAYNDGGIDGEKFKAVDKRYHGRCVGLCKKYGYEDMLFVNNEGNVLITVKKRPDLILMDMQMPVMDGFKATKHIREMEDLKDIPIIGLTARAMKGDREKVIAAGCSDYLPKPVMPNDLLRKVEEWLG